MQFILIGFVAHFATELVSYSDACKIPTIKEPCGYLPPNQPSRQLIHNGKSAETGHWPWLAYIKIKVPNEPFDVCTGFIIDREWILTAAHCLWPSDKGSDYCVIVGHSFIQSEKSGPDFSDFSENCTPFGQVPLKVIRHPIYNKDLIDNGPLHQKLQIMRHDIGLIKMARISFTTNVGRICSPSERQWNGASAVRSGQVTSQSGNNHGRSCHAAGWGRTETGHGSMHLLTLRSQIWNESDCQTNSYLGKIASTDFVYCYGGKFGESNARACRGDSGAPLFCQRSNGQYEAVGVVAFSEHRLDCTQQGIDGTASYAIRIPMWLDWIGEILRANTDRFKCQSVADILP